MKTYKNFYQAKESMDVVFLKEGRSENPGKLKRLFVQLKVRLNLGMEGQRGSHYTLINHYLILPVYKKSSYTN